MRRDRRVWLFSSASFAGNPKWLFLHVLHHRPDLEAWWMADSEEGANLVRELGLPSLTLADARAPQVLARAGVWAVNQVKEVIPEALTGIVLLNLWHGVGTKAIERQMNEGYLLERIARKYIRNNQAYHDTQLFLVTSPLMEQHFARQVGLAPRNIVRAGYPQNVRRHDTGVTATFDPDLLRRQGLPSDTRIALYAPTPRRDPSVSVLATAFPDVDRLVDRLQATDTMLIVKMHPHQSADPDFRRLRAHYADEPRLLFWDNRHDLYEVLDRIDLAVVDHSSILHDLLATGVRQVVRHLPDDVASTLVAETLSSDDLTCGIVTRNLDELLAALEPGRARVEASVVEHLRAAFWDYALPPDRNDDHIIEAALAFEVEHTPLPTLHSFDVFDTLIHRRSVTPRSIFAHVRQQAMEHGGYPSGLIDRYAYLRTDAEATARRTRRDDPRLTRSRAYEIAFDDIFALLQEQWRLDDRQTEQLRRWEVEGELRSVVANRERVAEVEALVGRGETVVLLSDMYLPRDVVVEILRRAHPLLADLPLFLSSELGVQKSTRQMYLQVYRELQYDFGEWIHTGDNPHADGEQAAALGITTRRVETPVLTSRGKHLTRYAPTYDSHLTAGLFVGRSREEPTRVQAFAYSVVSAFLVPYVSWVVDDAVRRGFTRLCFISRDGHHLQRIADALVAARDLPLTTQYLYGSRRAWRLASQVDGLDDDFLSTFGLFASVTSVDTLLEVAHLEREEAATMVPGLEHLLHQELLEPDDVERLVAALATSDLFRRHVLSTARELRKTVLGYLQQELDPDESTAFVEYWGRGYTQDCLTRLLGEAYGTPTPTHMYYARCIYPSEGLSRRYQLTITAHPNLIAVEAFFANTPYDTVTGYVREGDRFLPVTAPRDHEAELFDAMAEELPRFARDYAALPLVDPHRMDLDLFHSALQHLRTRPTHPYYVQFLAPLKDSVGLAGEQVEFAPALTEEHVAILDDPAALREVTRSVPMSLARATPPVRAAYQRAVEGVSPGPVADDPASTTRSRRWAWLRFSTSD